MAENKVQFGLTNVYYSVVTETTDAQGNVTYTYATPVRCRGAVSISLDEEGDLNEFYADNMSFYSTETNNGYSGTLELARVPESMLKDVWGYTEQATDHVLSEYSNTEPNNFALLFQIDGDENKQLYVLYNCSATRPSVSASTTGDTKEPEAQSLSIKVMPRADYLVRSCTNASTTSTVRSNWFSSVYVPST